jgi:hypothetical protein
MSLPWRFSSADDYVRGTIEKLKSNETHLSHLKIGKCYLVTHWTIPVSPKLPEPSPPMSQESLEERSEPQPTKKPAKEVVKMFKTMLPVKVAVNPSKQELWSENFQKSKECYDENGHSTLARTDPEYMRECLSSKWLTYQRHCATSLGKGHLELLESMNYKTVPMHR